MNTPNLSKYILSLYHIITFSSLPCIFTIDLNQSLESIGDAHLSMDYQEKKHLLNKKKIFTHDYKKKKERAIFTYESIWNINKSHFKSCQLFF